MIRMKILNTIEKGDIKMSKWTDEAWEIKKTWNEKSWWQRFITVVTFGIKTYLKRKGV
ncbi:hypothetical protein LCGC14_2919440 [marine sediment metagenome]|uniref:Uncharacterized protein n=1 Tax=marine sediment metagenome TaxID=412755 RepID=A0A0F8XPE6_9ZZZZ